MADIIIRNEAFGQAINAFRDAQYEINDIWQAMNTSANALEGVWKGEAATAFFDSFYGLDSDMTTTKNEISRIISELETTRQTFQEADEAIAAELG